MPAKPFNPMVMLFGKGFVTLPGLSGFFQTGNWATQSGALFVNALSGRKLVAELCRREGRAFSAE
jgi:hypothetical protein